MTDVPPEFFVEGERIYANGATAEGASKGENTIGDSAHHESTPDIVDAAEPPVKPEWEPGKAGPLGRWLMKIAGVDLHLALMMPSDELRQMRRVGWALVFGVMFQAICFGTALTVAFGLQPEIILVTFVLCGIMWQFDAK